MKNIDYKDFGNRIRIQRRKAKMTQAALAEKVGISHSFLGHLERGTRIPSLETVCLLCNVFKVMPRYFLASGLDEGLSFTALEQAEEEHRQRISDLIAETHAVLTEWNRLHRLRMAAEEEAHAMYDPGEEDETEDEDASGNDEE